MIAPVACWLLFLYNYIACATKNPGIIPRSPAPAQRTAQATDQPLVQQLHTPANRQQLSGLAGPADAPAENQTLSLRKPDAADPPQAEKPGELSLHRSRFCETCQITRPPFASHCRDCDNCVLQFDQ